MESFDLRDWSGFADAGGDIHTPAIIQAIAIDSRRIGEEPTLFIALSGGKGDGHDFVSESASYGARFALVKRDWMAPPQLGTLQLLRVEDPLTALQQIAGQYRSRMKATVLAITGSQGKTMLKDMLHALVKDTLDVVASPESFNSQIGVALSLLKIRSHHQLAIIEAGISKVNEMNALAKMIQPHHVILLNVDPQHSATLPDQATVASEKIKLAQNATGWILIPDKSVLKPYLKTLSASIHFWNHPAADLPHASLQPDQTTYSIRCPDGRERIGTLTFGYTYMLDLIAIAAKAAWLLGVDSETLTHRLVNYVPESMRTELWRTPSGITLINSPYCADPQSIDIGLAKLQETPTHCRKLFVFGGMRKEMPHPTDLQRIATAIQKAGVDHVYLHDATDSHLLELLQKSKIPVSAHSDGINALLAVKNNTHSGDHVLIMGATKRPLESLMELFDDGVPHNLCFINLAAIQHNLGILRTCLQPRTRIMVIVKALAYGTEDVRMARFLATADIDILGVSYVEEGVSLKRAGVSQAIFALNVTPYDVRKAVRWGLEVGVHSREIINALAAEATSQGKRLKVHLHVDTGMGRLGCRINEALSLAQLIQKHPSLDLEGLLTHFSCADDPNQDTFTFHQAHQFEQIQKQLKDHGIDIPYVHAANSAATLRFPSLHYDMVRIGLALYGLHASPATQQTTHLKLALSLTSRIVGVNTCRQGDSVSYGRCYTVKQPIEKIAVIPIGYFDGLHRHYSGKGWVMIREKRAPMVGNICMDYLMVNITDIPDAKIGDPVLVLGQDEFGQHLQPEELAGQGGSIIHELICCMGPRIQRVFIYE